MTPALAGYGKWLSSSRMPAVGRVELEEEKLQTPFLRLWGCKSEEDSSDANFHDASSDGEEDQDSHFQRKRKDGADGVDYHEDGSLDVHTDDEADERDDLIERVASFLIFVFVLYLLFYMRACFKNPIEEE